MAEDHRVPQGKTGYRAVSLPSTFRAVSSISCQLRALTVEGRLIAVLLLLTAPARAQQLDVLIVNGRVLDGAGNPWVRQDVGVRGDRIAWIGLASRDKPVARDTVDIRGLYL